MRGLQQDTPPSSINGDEIGPMEDEDGMIFMEEMTIDEAIEVLEGSDPDDNEDDTDMEPPEDHARLAISTHNGSVFCCDLHPTGKLAVTGGEDDRAYVWRSDSGKLVLDCTGHKDSVIFTGFSHDGGYLATADMCGVIKVWKCNSEDETPWSCVFEYEAEDLNWGLWHFGTRVLIFGADSGDIYVFKIPSGETKVLQGHNSKAECGKLFPDGLRLAAGYEDGTIKIWDLKSSTVVQQVPNTVHNTRITAVDTHENNVLASVSTDGKIVLTTSSNGKCVGQLEAENDLETIAFCQDPQMPYFATGTLNGSVNIWDISRQMVRHQCSKSEDGSAAGVTKMFWVNTHLLTGCLDGSIRVYEGRSGQKTLHLTGHMSEILDLSYNEKEKLIMTTSDDGTARLYNYDVNKVID